MSRRRSWWWWLNCDPATEPIWLTALTLVAGLVLLVLVALILAMLAPEYRQSAVDWMR